MTVKQAQSAVVFVPEISKRFGDPPRLIILYKF